MRSVRTRKTHAGDGGDTRAREEYIHHLMRHYIQLNTLQNNTKWLLPATRNTWHTHSARTYNSSYIKFNSYSVTRIGGLTQDGTHTHRKIIVTRVIDSGSILQSQFYSGFQIQLSTRVIHTIRVICCARRIYKRVNSHVLIHIILMDK